MNDSSERKRNNNSIVLCLLYAYNTSPTRSVLDLEKISNRSLNCAKSDDVKTTIFPLLIPHFYILLACSIPVGPIYNYGSKGIHSILFGVRDRV